MPRNGEDLLDGRRLISRRHDVGDQRENIDGMTP
jgi:hypothetical protein